MEKKTEFIHELVHPFEYAFKGETNTASAIKLLAPTSKQMKFTAPLKQQFMRAAHSIQQNNTEQREEPQQASAEGELEVDEVLTILFISSEDIMKPLLIALELFKSGVALIDGETKFTTPLFDLMDPDEFQEMVAEYMINFILASSLEKQKAK